MSGRAKRSQGRPAPYRPGWRGNVASVAVLVLLLQVLLGQAGMLRMVSGSTMAGMQMGVRAAGAVDGGHQAPGPAAHHHDDCPLCVGAGPGLQPVAPAVPVVVAGRQGEPDRGPARGTGQGVSRPYNPRAPPAA